MDSSHLADLYQEISRGQSTRIQEFSDEITEAYSHFEILPILCELLLSQDRNIQLSAAIGWKCCYKRHKSDFSKKNMSDFLTMLIEAMKNCYFEILETLIPSVAELSDNLKNYEQVNELAGEYISKEKIDHLIELYSEFGPHIDIDTPILVHITEKTIQSNDTKEYMNVHVLLVTLCQVSPELFTYFSQIKTAELLEIADSGNEQKLEKFTDTAGFLLKNQINVIDFDSTFEVIRAIFESEASIQMKATAASLLGEIINYLKPDFDKETVIQLLDILLEITVVCYNPECDQTNQIDDPRVISEFIEYFPESNEIIEYIRTRFSICLEDATQAHIYAIFVVMSIIICDFSYIVNGNVVSMFLEIILGLIEEIGIDMGEYTFNALSQLATLDSFADETDVYELVSKMIEIFKESNSTLALDTGAILLTQAKLSEQQFSSVFSEIVELSDDDEPIIFAYLMKLLYSLIGSNTQLTKTHSEEIFDIILPKATGPKADASSQAIFVIEKLISINRELMNLKYDDIAVIIISSFGSDDQIQKKASIALMGSVINYGAQEQWGVVLERFETLVEETRQLIDESDQYDVSGILFAYFVLYAKMLMNNEFMMEDAPYIEITNTIIELTLIVLKRKNIVECGLIVARQYVKKTKQLGDFNSLNISIMINDICTILKESNTDEELETITKYLYTILNDVDSWCHEVYYEFFMDTYIEKLSGGIVELPHIQHLADSLVRIIKISQILMFEEEFEKVLPLINGRGPAQTFAFTILSVLDEEHLGPYERDIMLAAIQAIRTRSDSAEAASSILTLLTRNKDIVPELAPMLIPLFNCCSGTVQANVALSAALCDSREPFLNEEQQRFVFSVEIDKEMILFWYIVFVLSRPRITKSNERVYIKALVRLLSSDYPGFILKYLGIDRLTDLMELYMPYRGAPWLDLTHEQTEFLYSLFKNVYM